MSSSIIATGTATHRSQVGLDWFAFFVADIQTGWGLFVAAYLTSLAWTQFDIGLILTIGTISAFTLQVPAGALVDALPAKRFLAAFAVACISGSALLLAVWPNFNAVVVAKVLHAMASCLLGPTIAAISLGLVGHSLLGVRTRPECPISFAWKRDRRRCGGTARLLFLKSSDLLFHRRPCHSHLLRPGANPIDRH